MFKRFSLSPYRIAQVIAYSLLVTIISYSLGPSIAIARTGQPNETIQAMEVTIPDGTEFEVVATEEISSKTATEGDPINFKVAEDVTINGRVVIAKGTLVKGSVSNAEKSGRMGKGGKLGIRIEQTTTVDEQKLKLRASKGKQGDDKTGTTVALVVLFGPLGLLKKGKDAKIKEGTKIKAYTDEDKKVQTKG